MLQKRSLTRLFCFRYEECHKIRVAILKLLKICVTQKSILLGKFQILLCGWHTLSYRVHQRKGDLWQCLTLFGTEMFFSPKIVSDLNWKNIAQNQTAQYKSWVEILEDTRLSRQQSFQQNCLAILCILAVILVDIYLRPRILQAKFVLPK
jgi:hypothetical protein